MTFLRIAVLGGYGFFGLRLVRRLAGWEGCTVRAAVPLLGMVARYHGWLDLATAEVLA